MYPPRYRKRWFCVRSCIFDKQEASKTARKGFHNGGVRQRERRGYRFLPEALQLLFFRHPSGYAQDTPPAQKNEMSASGTTQIASHPAFRLLTFKEHLHTTTTTTTTFTAFLVPYLLAGDITPSAPEPPPQLSGESLQLSGRFDRRRAQQPGWSCGQRVGKKAKENASTSEICR